MCCNRPLNNKIDRLHKRSLRIVYSDETSDFSELLEKDGSVSIHYQNIRQLTIEISRCQKVYVLKLRNDCFNLETTYLTT